MSQGLEPRSVKGPKADLTAEKSDFRFTPESGLKSDIASCPKTARVGIMHHSKWGLFDYLVGALLER